MKVACPHCQFAVEDDGSLSGQAVRCPACDRLFQMPVQGVSTTTLGEIEPTASVVVTESWRRCPDRTGRRRV